jgi:hypothetical protein
MLHVNQLTGFGATRKLLPVSLINRSSLLTSTGDADTYTFTSVDIGTASSTRRVVVGVVAEDGGTNGRTLETATIGGISATIHKQTTFSSGGSAVAAIFSAVVPTGTTATIVADFDGTGDNMNRCAIFVVAIDNVSSAIPFDTASDAGSPLSATINFPADGYVFAIATTSDNSAFSWTGLTERADGAYEDTQASAADSFPTVDSVNTTVSATPGSGTRQAMVIVAFR